MSSQFESGVKSKSSGIVIRKSISSFKVPKKATNESLLESVSIDSLDYTDEIEPHLQNNCRFRKLAADAIHVDEAWLVHNRKLDDAFGQAKKRLQKGDGLGRSQSVNVSLHVGFVFTDKWKNVETLVSEGVKPGNLPNTWLGKPNAGAVVSQCADISLAYLSFARMKSLRKSGAGRAALEEIKDGVKFYVVLCRWLKGRVYVVPGVSPISSGSRTGDVDNRLDPQPGYTCHMTKWTRLDPLDPAKTSLEAAFQVSQVYLYEYDDEMDLLEAPEHVVPFAVVSCSWSPSNSTSSSHGTKKSECLQQYSVSDGAILTTMSLTASHSSPKCSPYKKSDGVLRSLKKTNGTDPDPATDSVNTTSDKVAYRSLLGCPSTLPTASSTNYSKTHTDTLVCQRPPEPSLLGNPATAPLSELLAHRTPPSPQLSKQPPSFPASSLLGPSLNCRSFVPDSPTRLGRATQLGVGLSDRIGIQPCPRASDGIPRFIISCCNLVWPILDENSGSSYWQLPMEIVSYRNPGFSVFEGILQPKLVISGVISVTKLHYELAGMDEAGTEDSIDPRMRTKLAVCPYVSIDRLREWTVPTPEKPSENTKPIRGNFCGYSGNYLLFTLPDLTTQRCEVARLCETLKSKQLACVIRMPCEANASICIFPDSNFSRSLGIPQLDSLEAVSFHGIMLLPHPMQTSAHQKCACKYPKRRFSSKNQGIPQKDWVGLASLSLSSLVAALPDGGKGLLRKTVSLFASTKVQNDSQGNKFDELYPSNQLSAESKSFVPTDTSKSTSSKVELTSAAPEKSFSNSPPSEIHLKKTDKRNSGFTDGHSLKSVILHANKFERRGISSFKSKISPCSSSPPSDRSPELPVRDTGLSNVNVSKSIVDMFTKAGNVMPNLLSRNESLIARDGICEDSPARSCDMELDSSCESARNTPQKSLNPRLAMHAVLPALTECAQLKTETPTSKYFPEIPQPHAPPSIYSPHSFSDSLFKPSKSASQSPGSAMAALGSPTTSAGLKSCPHKIPPEGVFHDLPDGLDIKSQGCDIKVRGLLPTPSARINEPFEPPCDCFCKATVDEVTDPLKNRQRGLKRPSVIGASGCNHSCSSFSMKRCRNSSQPRIRFKRTPSPPSLGLSFQYPSNDENISRSNKDEDMRFPHSNVISEDTAVVNHIEKKCQNPVVKNLHLQLQHAPAGEAAVGDWAFSAADVDARQPLSTKKNVSDAGRSYWAKKIPSINSSPLKAISSTPASPTPPITPKFTPQIHITDTDPSSTSVHQDVDRSIFPHTPPRAVPPTAEHISPIKQQSLPSSIQLHTDTPESPPKQEEEEGEILDDDEELCDEPARESDEAGNTLDEDSQEVGYSDFDGDCECNSSYSLSPPKKRIKQFYVPRQKLTKKYLKRRKLWDTERTQAPYDPCSVMSGRAIEDDESYAYNPNVPYQSDFSYEPTYTPSIASRNVNYQDVDYRHSSPVVSHSNVEESTDDTDISENGDRDYRVFSSVRPMPSALQSSEKSGRYQVYVPKSAETVSLPVKVINHALNEHSKFSPSGVKSQRRTGFGRGLLPSIPSPQPQKPTPSSSKPISSSILSIVKPRNAPLPRSSHTAPLMGEPPISAHRFISPNMLPINSMAIVGRQVVSGICIPSGQPLLGMPNLIACPSGPLPHHFPSLGQAAFLPYYPSLLNCRPPSWSRSNGSVSGTSNNNNK